MWNEPNLRDYLSPQIVGRRAVGHIIYARLVRAAYRAVKRADPGAKVLIGETSPSNLPLRFIERAARALPGGLRADGWAQHPYQFVKISPLRPQRHYTGGISNVGAMKVAMRRLARTDKLRTRSGAPLPLYLTEFGTRAPAPTTGTSPRRCATGTRSRPSGWPSARARRCWCGTSSTTIPGGLAPVSGTRA